MCSVGVKVDGLAEAIQEELNAYSEDLMDGIRKEVAAVAKNCMNEIKTASPEDTGEYRAGWRVKRAHESDDDIRLTVHNKGHAQRTHLLEDGHANVDGGRTPGTPHIGPAADKAAAELEGRIKVVLCHGSG